MSVAEPESHSTTTTGLEAINTPIPLSDSDHTLLRRVFEIMDVDNSGDITIAEFISKSKKRLDKAGIGIPKQIINATRNDTDGLTLDEFVAAMSKHVVWEQPQGWTAEALFARIRELNLADEKAVDGPGPAGAVRRP